MGMLEVLEEARNVKPITRRGGVDLVTFEDQTKIAQADLTEKVDLTPRTLNPDGSIARSRYTNAAISPESYFINRYKVKQYKLYIVTDYRAIKEQSSGRIYTSTVPAYVLKRNKEDKTLEYEGVVQIGDQEFVSDFTKQLNREAMEEVLPLIYLAEDYSSDNLPI